MMVVFRVLLLSDNCILSDRDDSFSSVLSTLGASVLVISTGRKLVYKFRLTYTMINIHRLQKHKSFLLPLYQLLPYLLHLWWVSTFTWFLYTCRICRANVSGDVDFVWCCEKCWVEQLLSATPIFSWISQVRGLRTRCTVSLYIVDLLVTDVVPSDDVWRSPAPTSLRQARPPPPPLPPPGDEPSPGHIKDGGRIVLTPSSHGIMLLLRWRKTTVMCVLSAENT